MPSKKRALCVARRGVSRARGAERVEKESADKRGRQARGQR
jgi:hypothetical protein